MSMKPIHQEMTPEQSPLIHTLFEHQANCAPDAIALAFENQELTYRELDLRANRLAHYLQKLGVGPEVLVGVCLERGAEMIVGLLAILKAGGAYVPLDQAYPQERLAMMLADSRASLVLTQAALRDRLPEGAYDCVCLDTDRDLIAREPSAGVSSSVTAENMAYLIYTSGSTGRPKGVSIQHASVVGYVEAVIPRFGLQPADRVLQFASINFDASVEEIFATLACGATLVLRTDAMLLSTAAFLQACRDWGLTVLDLPTAYWHMVAADLVREQVSLPPQLRLVIIGGEQALPERAADWQERFGASVSLFNAYGPTEATIAATLCELTTLNGKSQPLRSVPIGNAISTMRAYILDASMQPVPTGASGELYLGGTGVARGYLNRPGITAERFVPDPFGDVPGSRLYKTGDLACFLPDGQIEFLGRIDNQVKIRGYRIELGEIEAVLSRHPGLDNVVVAAHAGANDNKRLVAYFVSGQQPAPGARDLRRFLKARLPDYMVPSFFIRLDAMPLTPNGKIDRRALPAPDEEHLESEALFVAPRTPVEATLATIWGEVLHTGQIGVNDDFFELGGDSLLAAQIVSRLIRHFSIALTPAILFENPTVAGLAAAISNCERTAAGPVSVLPEFHEGPVPQSFAQQRIWFMTQLVPGSPLYNVPVIFDVTGELDATILHACLNEVVRRHEILRTLYGEQNGEMVQRVKSYQPIELPVMDLRDLPPSEREARRLALLDAYARRPFDLTAEIPLRALLIRLDAHAWQLLLTIHHIAVDGWSFGVIQDEIRALYPALARGEVAPLPAPNLQYADYARWHENQLQAEALAASLAYWKDRLAGDIPVLSLPTDRARPSVPSYRGRRLKRTFSDALLAQLKAVGREHSASLTMTMLAGFLALLHRYCGQTDLVVGMPIANRGLPELEALVGFFVNSLPLRFDLSGNPTFVELVRQVQQVTLEAYAHQDVPLEKIVAALDLKRESGYNPLIQVMFAVQNMPDEAIRLPEVQILPAGEVDTGSAKFDLTLYVEFPETGFDLIAEYSTDLFDAATIERFLDHYVILLSGAIANPQRAVASLDILPAWERQRLLVEWNATQAGYPSGQCLHKLLEAQAARTPQAIALISGEERLTYAALNERANRLAHSLRALGVGPETCVALYLERTPDFVIGALAAWKAGGAYVPIDPAYPPARVNYIIADTRAPVVLTQTHLAANLAAGAAHVLRLDVERDAIAGQPADPPDVMVWADSLAYVIYTSGSTGQPKGTPVSHCSLLNLANWHAQVFAVTAADRMTQVAGLGFDAMLLELWPHLLHGASVSLVPEAVRSAPEALRDWLVAQNATITFQPTPLAEVLLELPWPATTRLRLCVTGGDRLRRYPPADLPFALVNDYGPTENTVVSTFSVVAPDGGTGTPDIGRPVSNTQAYILDANLEPVPIGVVGELYLGGVGLARGYLNRPALTAEKFLPNPFSADPGARLYKTGDLVRYLPDGRIAFLGRIDHQVKVHGFRIELGEIEAALAQHPSIQDLVVVAREGTGGDKYLVAYVVFPEDVPLKIGDLRQFLATRLPDYMIPAVFVRLDALPLTPNGKIDRRALPAPDAARLDLGSDYVAPRTPVEQVLAQIWSQVLVVKQVGIHDNFFELGGHSLLATRVMSRLRDVFHVDLPLRAIFEARTIANLAVMIGDATSDGQPTPAIRPLPEGAEPALSFSQQRLWFIDQLEPDNPVYNIPTLVRLEGSLDQAALEKSLNEIVRRHAILRSSLTGIAGRPVQSIAAELNVPLTLVDLQHLSAAEREFELQRLAAAEAWRPFDLSRSPLLRTCLYQLARDESVLLLVVHHSVFDGWSIGIFNRELTALYNAFSKGLPSPLPDLVLQYPDFAAWQREWLQGDVLETQLAYWQQRLGGVLPVLDLPVDRPWDEARSWHAASQSCRLPAMLVQALERLSQKANASLFMTLLAAFKVLFFRYTGQEDIIIGTPIAGRNHSELEGLIGFFLNTLAIRTDLSNSPGFVELLQRVRESLLDAYKHQDLPFEKLVEVLQPRRDLHRSPIFDVMFNFINTPNVDMKLGGLECRVEYLPASDAKYAITLYAEHHGAALDLELVYRRDLFSEERIAGLLSQYQSLLEQVAAAPERSIADYTLVTPAMQLLLPDPGAALLPRDAATVSRTVTRMFSDRAAQFPGQIAIRQNGQRWTYGQLERKAREIARMLVRKGSQKGDVIAVYGSRSFGLVAGMLGVFFGGGVLLTLDPRLPAGRIQTMLGAARARYFLHVDGAGPDDVAPVAGNGMEIIRMDPNQGPGEFAEAEGPALPVLSGDDPAYLFFTSGTTGVPKGVLGTHKGLAHFLDWQSRTFAIGRDDVCAQLTGLSFDVVLRDIFTPLTGGATLCLPERDVYDANYILPWMESEGITVIHTVPAIMKSWLANAPGDVSLQRLRLLFSAGEPLKADLVHRWRRTFSGAVEMVNLYGPTETTLAKCYYRVPDPPRSGVQPVGRPLPETQALVLSGNRRLCGVGEAGEIVIRTPFRSLGYVNAPDEMHRRFVPNPFREDTDDLLYYTGDRGRYLPDGALEILGRIDNQVKIHGVRIEPGEVEAVLARHPAVRDCLVLARPRMDAPDEKMLVAYFTARQADPPAAEALRGFLREKMPEPMIPSAYVFLEAFPLTANGKIDHRALPEPDQAQMASTRAYVPPGTPVETVLAGIWSEVLALETVSVHDNFFDLGGHSLIATQITSRVRDRLGIDLPVRDLFAAPSVAALAARIEAWLPAQSTPATLAEETPPVAIRPQPAGTPRKLSFAQRRMWFLQNWQPESPAYNIANAYRFYGELNVPALHAAFCEILRRHEVLQMVFTPDGDEPQLAPLAAARPWLPLPLTDLGALPGDAREAEMQRLAVAEAARPFDLAGELPIRAALLRLDEREHVLLLTIHHIAGDGWSTGLLIKELVTLYAAYNAGKPSPLAELPIQYADFAAWQQDWLQNGAMDSQLAYWRKQLAGAPAILELPIARPRPAVRTSNGAIHRFRISPAVAQAIRALSQQEKVTPFMILLGAFQILLHRYTGQTDIVVGTPIANRNHSEIEPLIGFFVNTLVLRTDLSGNPTLRQLLQRVREVTLDAYAHQDVPFEKLVEDLQPDRNLSHNPLFQIMFIYQNMPNATLRLPGLTIENLEFHNSTAKFDLNVVVEDIEDGFDLAVTYSTDLFDATVIRRLAEHYRMLLAGIAADPEAVVAALPLLTAEERQQLQTWSDTGVAYPPFKCLHQVFAEQAARIPDRTAVVSEGRSYTYAELNRRANQVAHFLRTLGVGPDVRVGLFMERSLDIMVALLGILKAGGAYVPVDPIYPADRVRFMLDDVQVPVLLTQEHLAGQLPDLEGIRVVRVDKDWDTIAAHSAENPDVPVSLSNLMYVLFTSGSTGLPKGVAVEHRNYLNYFHGIVKVMPLEPGMHFAMVSTFATDLGTIMFWGAFYVGGLVHIVPYERATDPDGLADYFRQHPIDVLKLVPSHLEALLISNAPEHIVPKKLLVLTGEASYWNTVAKVRAINPDCVVQDHYGVTETTCATLVYTAPEEIPEQHDAALPKGDPLGNVRIHILDDRMAPTPIGVPGELYIGGDGVTRGYINRPDLTKERFIPDPFGRKPGARLYKTGDLACYLPDGRMKLLGRIDFQVKIRGYRIELGEIETLLSEDPTVQDAVVMAREDTPGDRRLVAYVVPLYGHDGDFSVNALRDSLRQRLPDYMVPTAFVALDAIPLNPNGKVDRFALPAPDYAQIAASREVVAPRNDLEARLAAIWGEVLDIEEVSIDDDFFDLGGDSFKAIRVVRKIGGTVSIIDLFKYRRIRDLAGYIGAGQPRHTGLLHELTPPVQQREKKLSLVCVPYGGGSAVMYQPLADAMPRGHALYAVALPGHDFSRKDEELQSIESVARQCAQEIKNDIAGPVALYGHCVGGALAVEIARLLEADGVAVKGVFLGGTFPSPRLPGKFFEWLHKLFPSDRWQSTRSIYDTLRALGGFTDLMDPQEREFVLRNLKHDAERAEDYYTLAYSPQADVRIQAPILCIVGQMDRATEFYQERYKEWATFSATVALKVIPNAGHYFLKHQADELAGSIVAQLAAWEQAPEAPAVAVRPRDERPAVRREERAADVPQKRRAGASLTTFFLVAFGQFASLLGTGLTSFALGVWVFQKTGEVSDLGFIWFFVGLPGILFAPLAGAVADRWDRRWVMLLSDMMAGLGTLTLAWLLWSGTLQIWHIYVVTAINSIANTFQEPAYVAGITQLVPKQYLGNANGIVELAHSAGTLLAPLFGGMLVVLIGLHGVVLIDVGTCLFAIVVLLLVRFPNTMFRKREESFWQELAGGWNYIMRRKGMRTMIGCFAVSNFLQSVVRVLITPLVLLFQNPSVLGTVMSANGVGMLIGGLVMSVWGGSRRRTTGILAFFVLLGASTLTMGLRPSPLFVAMGLFGVGLSVAMLNAHWLAVIQAKVGLELQGRVISIENMLSWSIQPLGFILAGPLVEKVFEPLMTGGGSLANSVGRLIGVGAGRGMGLVMILAGVITIIVGLWGYRYRPLRYLEDALPDAIPDAVIVEDKDLLQKQADRQL
ncbi:MAG: amino acid adenylation domain-containing protein [Anaerolineae bacterium]|nr:amino acid adenylation domain-containing protein [Anaerolineae bacterium]